ncbi:MAG: hypothetical protein IKE42_15050 [Aquamicrobium sp.]|nr:hypothetical protein [Aquamicrobium sp.]
MAEVAADGPIRAFFEAGWGATTRVAYENEEPAAPWPPVNGDAELVPWAFLETIVTGSGLAGATGLKGRRLWCDEGLIHVHIFVPIGEGKAIGNSLAKAAGEIFRAAAFHEGPDGRAIRTLAPIVSSGGSAGDDERLSQITGTNSIHSQWFRATMTVEFAYFHRG